ncbi:MAG: YidB family protein [Bacteriovorax sp.]|jgi:uncharacterized protein YidB (DUF937 family)
MSFLDAIKDKVMGENQPRQTTRLISELINECDGLDGLVEKFNASGFGDTIATWLSPGLNRPVTTEQIQKILGPTLIHRLSIKFGLDTNLIASQLAAQLPKYIDKLTPDGQIPTMDQVHTKMDEWKNIH